MTQKKKSFLIATVLTPLIFPAILAVFVWIAVEEKENQSLLVIEVVDETGLFFMESSEQYAFSSSSKTLEEAKALVLEGERYGALYLPKMELSSPQGIQFYGIENPSTALIGYLEAALKRALLLRPPLSPLPHTSYRTLPSPGDQSRQP